MANPSPAAIAAIQAHVTDWGPGDQAITDALNTPDRANPVEQNTVLKVLTAGEVLGVLAPETLPNLKDVAGYIAAINQDIQIQNRVGVGLHCRLLTGMGVITQADCDAITAVLSATEPDANWQAQISWAQAELGRVVDTDDIAASRPQGA